jgi:hypothetical protein
MQVNPKVEDIVSKVFDGHSLTRDEIAYLLSINRKSLDAGFIMNAANVVNRIASKGKAEVHAQIGLNLSPCPNAKKGILKSFQTKGELKKKKSTGKGVFLVFDVECKNQDKETAVMGTTTVQIVNKK